MNGIELEEKAILDQHEPSWVAQGYKVVRQPSGEHLPEFLHSYKPDAILVGRTPYVVVEVLRKGQLNIEHKIQRLKTLLAGHDDWRLEVLYAGIEPEQLPEVPSQQLRAFVATVRKLASTEQRGALLLLWSVLEALTRRLEPTKTRRPQSPGRVVELLAGAGYIAPSDAEHLRDAVQWRNRLVHGDLTISPSKKQILKLADLVEEVISSLEAREAV